MTVVISQHSTKNDGKEFVTRYCEYRPQLLQKKIQLILESSKC
jgi:hypothetical protein